MVRSVPRKARRRALVSFLMLGLAGAIVFWTEPLALFAALERATPNLVWQVRTDQPLVGLSFDDGPDPRHTPQVLELLQRFGARATFFLIGGKLLGKAFLSEIAAGESVALVHERGAPLLSAGAAVFERPELWDWLRNGSPASTLLRTAEATYGARPLRR